MWTALLFNRFTAGALGLALLAGAYSMHRSSLIQQGYETAMAKVREAENDRLRELLREHSRLVLLVKGLQDAQEAQKREVARFRDGQRVADQRLRDAQADFDRRLAAANAEALRRYAKTVDGDLGRCEADVERFAGEAAQCSIAAHALKGYVDALP